MKIFPFWSDNYKLINSFCVRSWIFGRDGGGVENQNFFINFRQKLRFSRLVQKRFLTTFLSNPNSHKKHISTLSEVFSSYAFLQIKKFKLFLVQVEARCVGVQRGGGLGGRRREGRSQMSEG